MRKRADIVLVERGFFSSRARAQAAIAAGLVSVGGVALRKASDAVADDSPIEAEEAHPWASRGGVKLAAALDAFALDPDGLACLDVGASTEASPTSCSRVARRRSSPSMSVTDSSTRASQRTRASARSKALTRVL